MFTLFLIHVSVNLVIADTKYNIPVLSLIRVNFTVTTLRTVKNSLPIAKAFKRSLNKTYDV